MNAVNDVLRASGGIVIWVPSDAAEAYVGWPQRERIFRLPRPDPARVRNSSIPQSLPAGVVAVGGDQCGMSGHGCIWNWGEARMHPALRIAASDYISGSAYDVHDVYAVLRHHGVKTVLHGGIA